MTRPGAVAEWLGRGLQSLVQQFESARRLRPSSLEAMEDELALVEISGNEKVDGAMTPPTPGRARSAIASSFVG